MPKYALKNGVMVKETLIHSEILMSISRNPKQSDVLARIKSKQKIVHSDKEVNMQSEKAISSFIGRTSSKFKLMGCIDVKLKKVYETLSHKVYQSER
jgi:hypothetical protein